MELAPRHGCLLTCHYFPFSPLSCFLFLLFFCPLTHTCACLSQMGGTCHCRLQQRTFTAGMPAACHLLLHTTVDLEGRRETPFPPVLSRHSRSCFALACFLAFAHRYLPVQNSRGEVGAQLYGCSLLLLFSASQPAVLPGTNILNCPPSRSSIARLENGGTLMDSSLEGEGNSPLTLSFSAMPGTISFETGGQAGGVVSCLDKDSLVQLKCI